MMPQGTWCPQTLEQLHFSLNLWFCPPWPTNGHLKPSPAMPFKGKELGTSHPPGHSGEGRETTQRIKAD